MRDFLLDFFFNDTATTEIYTLSLHDALPIFRAGRRTDRGHRAGRAALGSAAVPRYVALRRRGAAGKTRALRSDRKNTRLNSSHTPISYIVFCLEKNTTRAIL